MTNIVTFSGDRRDFGSQPEEPWPLCRCRKCRGDIWPGETYGVDGAGKAVCVDCARDEFISLMPAEQLMLMGLEPVSTVAAPRRRHLCL